MPFDFTKLPGEQLGGIGMTEPGCPSFGAGSAVFGVLLFVAAAGDASCDDYSEAPPP